MLCEPFRLLDHIFILFLLLALLGAFQRFQIALYLAG